MFKKIFAALLLAIGILFIYAAFQPPEYVISREILIMTSPDKIFPYINDAKKMNSWNPWSELDPKVVMTFSGPEEGVGAKTSWEGGERLGTGSATIAESIPNSLVKTKLEYMKPFEMTQDAEISLTPSGDGTLTKWSVRGKNSLIGRMMCFFINPEKMVGGTFENGLKKLKQMVEAPAL